jgi:uncharacterized protein (DUF952 family)
MSHIFHIAKITDWDAARAAGDYRVSTLGQMLAEVGFIHCSTASQVQKVADRVYCGVEHLVLLTIETELLSASVRFDPVNNDSYPHIYGPLNLDAVIDVTPLVTEANGHVKAPDLSSDSSIGTADL